jgi:capsular exopolysaccharide synthesis family protein
MQIWIRRGHSSEQNMSLIFDALQRSEAERSGVDSSALPAATEVLQLAERHAVSERKATTQFEQPGGLQNAQRDTPLPLQAVQPTAVAVEASGPTELSLHDEHLEVFAQFATQQATVLPESRLVCFTDSESLAAENFRFLGIRLQHLRRERALKKVLITSTIPQEGKSMVSANLACTLARRTQQRTLLVEGDVRRPALSRMFGLEAIPGLCECLQGTRDLMKSVYHLEGPGLWFLPAGNASTNPLEFLQSASLSTMMDPLTGWFDWIVIDSPPVMPLADTSLWMRLADGILLVVRQGVTEKRQLERGLEAIERKKLIGTVLNGAKRQTSSDDYYTRVPSISSRPSTS